MQRYAVISLLVVVLSVAGCASYKPLPLARHARAAASLEELTMPTSAFKTPGLHAIRVDPNRPLNADAIAALAVLNDPVLVAVRAKLGVVTAQSYAAGLLPWPQISLGAGRASPSGPGLSGIWSAALDQSVAELLQHHARVMGARASEKQVRLDVIWDEWQVAQRARLLYADIELISVEQNALKPLVRLYQGELKAAQEAVVRHAVSQSAAMQVQAAGTAVVARLDSLDLKRDRDVDKLRRLLGLSPHALLRLALDDHPPTPRERTVSAAIAALPARRPDLMALAAAYGHSDERLRQAVLSQFPLIGISVARKRDTGGVVSNDLSLTFDLPFFNDARGAVAEARASRLALHDAYAARLDDAATEAFSLSDEARHVQRTLARLRESLVKLAAVPEDAALGDLSFDTMAAYVQRKAQIATTVAQLQYSLDRANIALDTVLGMPLDATRTDKGGSA